MLTLTFGVIIAVGVEVVPNSLLTIAMASSLPPSQVMATVLVAVVGVGLTTLLRVDILPWLFGSLILLVVCTRWLGEMVGVIIWVVLSIIVYVKGLVTLRVTRSFLQFFLVLDVSYQM